jgi:hypothetical protein
MSRYISGLNVRSILIWGFLAAIIFLLAAGCAQKYGSLQRSADVSRAFQEFQSLQDFSYYYQGLESQPFAIAGIHHQYQLNSRLWKQFDPTAAMLEKMINRMVIRYGYEPHGFVVLDHNGIKIGIWYSSFHWASVQTDADNNIVVLAPEAPASGTHR